MNAPQVMTHPSDEIVAAFLDGRLAGEERQRVLDHTSECDECYSLSSAVWDYKAEPPGGEVVRPQFGRRFAVAAASLAVAAGVVVVFLGPIRDRNARKELLAADAQMSERLVAGRLSGFAYHPHDTMRGGGESKVDPAVAKTLLEARAYEAAEKARDPHLAGVAYLVLGERDLAIQKLTEAAKRKPRDVAILNDLATAHYERSRYGGGEGHITKSREIADRAWSIEKTPLTAWTRAQAWNTKAAWQEYLVLDPDSEWASEVKEKHLEYAEP